MPFIQTDYAALIYGIKRSALTMAVSRNSTRYTYAKYGNKLLFKVTSAQIRIALNKGLIDANIEVYNDNLTLIQDFFKTNSIRRANGKANSNKKGVVDGCNSNSFKSSSNIVLGCGVVGEFKHKDILTNNKGVVDDTTKQERSESDKGQYESGQEFFTQHGCELEAGSIPGCRDGHKICTSVFGASTQETKHDDKSEQGELNDTQSKTSAKAIKRDRSNDDAFSKDRALQLTSFAGDENGLRERDRGQANTDEECAGDEKRLLAHSSSKSSSTTLDNQGGGDTTKILKECDMSSNHTLLKAFFKDKESGDNSLLSEANEKALLLDKIEQRVANNESIKSICKELGLSRQQYYRMSKAYKEQGLAGLVDKRAISDKKSIGASIPDVLKTLALDLWRGFGAGGVSSYAQLHRQLHAHAYELLDYDYKGFLDNKTDELFSVKTLIAFIEEYKKQNYLEALVVEKGLDKAKSYAQPAMGNQKAGIFERNQKWQIDSSPLDGFVMDEQGNESRPHILSVVDVYSGRCVAMLSDTSNALSLVRLLWKAIDTMGLPECIKGDNGKDYLSNHFQSVLNKLGILFENTQAYSGELKAYVERHFKTMQHSFIASSAGAIGHDLATRQTIEQRTPKKERKAKNEFGKVKKTNQTELLSFDEATQLLENAVNYWNLVSNKRVKDRKSRLDVWSESDTQLIKVSYDYFLARAGECKLKKVQKKGINLNSRTYISNDMPSVGTSVKVVTNIDNVAEIYIYDTDFNFICIAYDNAVTSLSSEEYKAHKKAFDKELQAINKVIKDVNVGEFTRTTLEIEKKVLKELNDEKLKDTKFTTLDDKSHEKYKQKRALFNEVSGCDEYIAPEKLKKDDEDEMSYEDLIKNSKIG